jgi:hypothetical protein
LIDVSRLCRGGELRKRQRMLTLLQGPDKGKPPHQTKKSELSTDIPALPANRSRHPRNARFFNNVGAVHNTTRTAYAIPAFDLDPFFEALLAKPSPSCWPVMVDDLINRGSDFVNRTGARVISVRFATRNRCL